MGRAKVKMELIEKEKSRYTTFKKRKEGLIRKAHELATLCDVSACVIIYGGSPDQSLNQNPQIWPSQSPDEVRRVVDAYRSGSSAAVKTFGVADFFRERKKQIEEELDRLRWKNLQARYPTRPALLDRMNESQLRQLHALLADRARAVRSRIELLGRSNSYRSDLQAAEMLVDRQRLLELNDRDSMHQFGDSSADSTRRLLFEPAAGYYAPPPAYLVPPPCLSIMDQEEMIRYQVRNLNLQDEEVVMNRFFSG